MNELRAQIVYDSSLVGANLERADLRSADLRGINLTNANLRGADLSYADLSGGTLIKADLSRANLTQAKFHDCNMTNADLTMSYGRGTQFIRTKMWIAYIRRMTHKNCYYIDCDLRGADLLGSEFLGTKFDGSRTEGIKNADLAHYVWWYYPMGGQKVSHRPIPGWVLLDESVTGGISVQENAAREQVEEMVREGWRK